MATLKSLERYKQQFDALAGEKSVVTGQNSAVARLLETYGKKPDYETDPVNGLPRRSTILNFLNAFQEFTKSHFDFFHHGFAEPPLRNYELSESTMEPGPVVLGTILYQMSVDLELIQRAAEQRLAKYFLDTLELADKLACLALEQAKDMLPPDVHVTAISYFDKMPQIRVSPYAPIAMVGIPMSSIYERRDLLAIPHEVGHFLYHYRKHVPTQDPVDHSYVGNPKQEKETGILKTELAHWQEELFADVFGAKVAGPVMAYDFQQMMRVYQYRALADQTDSHPSPALRPLIYSYVLRKNPEWMGLADQLDAEWRALLQERWQLTYARRGSFLLRNSTGQTKQEWITILGESDKVKDLEAEMTLEKLVKMRNKDYDENGPDRADGIAKLKLDPKDREGSYYISLYNLLRWFDLSDGKLSLNAELQKFIQEALKQISVTDSKWSGELAAMDTELKSGGKPDEPYKKGLTELVKSVKVNELEIPPASPEGNLWEKWIIREKLFGGILPTKLEPETPGGKIRIDKGEYDDILLSKPLPIKDFSWVPVWYAGGWTTKPPGGSPPGD